MRSFLPLLPASWDSRCVSPSSVYMGLRINPGALGILIKHSKSWDSLQSSHRVSLKHACEFVENSTAAIHLISYLLWLKSEMFPTGSCVECSVHRLWHDSEGCGAFRRWGFVWLKWVSRNESVTKATSPCHNRLKSWTCEPRSIFLTQFVSVRHSVTATRKVAT